MGTFIPTIAVNRRRFEVNEVNGYGATGLKISCMASADDAEREPCWNCQPSLIGPRCYEYQIANYCTDGMPKVV